MSSKPLSDDQVAGELRKMVEFIKKEADEKAKEIELKANEEYEIDKASIVRSETASIDLNYERKYKQAQLSQQIAKSTVANEMRLKVLGEKEASVAAIFEDATRKLSQVSKDKTKYSKLMEGLIEEGLLALMEDEFSIRVRKSDKKVAENAIKNAVSQYEEKTKKEDVKVNIDENTYLDDKTEGGVVVVSKDGRITVDNTLSQRLRLLSENALPLIRTTLFGASETRKFYD